MNLIMLKDFFTEYSVSTIVIALLSAAIKIVVDRFATSKTAKRITWYLPFLTGVLFGYLYQLIFLKTVTFDENVVYSGVISGTLAYAFALIIRRIYRGEALPDNPALAVIEGLVDGYVQDDCVQEVILVIYQHYVDSGKDQKGNAVEKITDTLNGYSNGMLASAEIITLAQMIIKSLDELTD